MHENATCNDLQEIITQAINEIKQRQDEKIQSCLIGTSNRTQQIQAKTLKRE